MNRYESILLDKMVDVWREHRAAESTREKGECEHTVSSLLDCICDFREPPRGTPLEEGCGVLVDMRGEVVA